MNITKKIILAIFLIAVVVPGFAAGKKLNNMKQYWSNPVMSYCLGQSLGDACVGNSLAGCKNWNGAGKNQPNRGTFNDEMATLLLLARDVNANGARFCVTQAQGANKNKGDAWTNYYNPAGNIAKCFWLCKPGHSGEGCGGGESTLCDSTTIKKSDFAGYKITTSGPSVEGEVAMFHWDEYKGCGLNKSQEHDMVLGISGWTASGHGAFARPMVVRSQRDGWSDMVSTATIWMVGSDTLLCKDGYQPNTSNTDCVAVNGTACMVNTPTTITTNPVNTFCAGWDKASFSETNHVLKLNGTCFEYRCQTAGMAFTSASNRTCVECAGDARVGVPDSTGVCVKCPSGKIFDNNGKTTGFCKNSIQFTTQDLAFGPNKNKNTNLMDQCWTKIEPTAYKNCVLNNKVSTTTATTATTVPEVTPTVPDVKPIVIDKPLISTPAPTTCKVKAITNGTWAPDSLTASSADGCTYTEIDGISCNSGYVNSGASCKKSVTTVTKPITTTPPARNCIGRKALALEECLQEAAL